MDVEEWRHGFDLWRATRPAEVLTDVEVRQLVNDEINKRKDPWWKSVLIAVVPAVALGIWGYVTGHVHVTLK